MSVPFLAVKKQPKHDDSVVISGDDKGPTMTERSGNKVTNETSDTNAKVPWWVVLMVKAYQEKYGGGEEKKNDD